MAGSSKFPLAALVDLESLIDLEGGTISRKLFSDQILYQFEQEKIFARSWLFVGHESLIPNAGDFFTSYMGEESIILARGKSGEIHAMLNSCRHRGTRVCRSDHGNTAAFYCPYHGWSYDSAGRLIGVPHYAEGYQGKLDRSKWGLIPVAQLANYKGSLWATWDASAPPLEDYLGGMKFYLDLALDATDGQPGGSEVIGGIQKWIVPCNWKLGAENFGVDHYHGVSHRSVDTAAIGPSGKGRRDLDGMQIVDVSFPGRGHGASARINHNHAAVFQNYPAVAEYFKTALAQRRRRHGDGADIWGGPGTIFPNASIQGFQPRTFALWHPRGPRETEVWRFYLVDRDAPEEVKDVLRRYFMRYAGPGGMTEQDDMENWRTATEGARGVIGSRYPFNYQLGLDRQLAPNPLVPGIVTMDNLDAPSEGGQREFYRRWLRLMSAAD